MNNAAPRTPPPSSPELTKERLDTVVHAVQSALADPSMRQLSQRAVQAKLWHEQPVVASVLQDLRHHEEAIRACILRVVSQLVYRLHETAMDATLDRAGIHCAPCTAFGKVCLDAKERLYMILKEYDWLQDFFRQYPLHFYENSFSFVHLIPSKELPVTVQVIGLGIGGSMAVSGLAKRGIAVTGYEKRPERGPSSVTSRYQNASWRAYDTAASMVDDTAFEVLASNRQKMHVRQQDGSIHVVSSDRVQIILGSAIQAALDSARRYNANLVFDCQPNDYMQTTETSDLVALFCGAHTVSSFPELEQSIPIYAWPELNSPCRMWLCARESDKTEAYTTRSGEVGAEHWHYTIESARADYLDLERVQWNQVSQHKYNIRKHGETKEEETVYEEQSSKLQDVLDTVRKKDTRFDYIFTNAPLNPHNQSKRDAVEETVVLEGGYTVEVKMAIQSSVFESDITTEQTSSSSSLLRKLNAKHLVMGGDACVPPNPMAAYGATLACEAAYSLVLMATAIGHSNAILSNLSEEKCSSSDSEVNDLDDLLAQVKELKKLLLLHYEARAVAENYFQWVQTLICNVYSIPPMES